MRSQQRAVAIALAVARSQVAADQRVWSSPRLLTLHGWITQLLHAHRLRGERVSRALSGVEEWTLWRRAAQDLVRRSSSALYSADSLADALRESAVLAGEHGISAAALSQYNSEEASWLAQAMRAVSRMAADVSAVAEHDLGSELARSGAPDERTTMAGLDDPLPGQWRKRLAQWRASGAPIDQAARWPDAAAASLLIAQDGEDELRRIAAWCSGQIERDPAARLLVVIPDLAARLHEVRRILVGELDPAANAAGASESSIVSIEGGQTFAHYPQIAAALRTLQLFVAAQPSPEVLSWLLECGGPAEAASLARLELALRGRLPDPCTPEQLLAALPQADRTAAAAVARLAERITTARSMLPRALRTTMADWAQRISQALRACGWPGDAVADSAAEQMRARWRQLLEECVAASAVLGPIDFAGACALLAGRARRIRFAPASADVAITITGDTGDPVVRYDGIWVAGVSADAWPPRPRPDPFIPWPLQQAAGVIAATADSCAQRARAEYAAWRAATPELRFSVPRSVDGAPLAPSPLLRGVAIVKEPAARLRTPRQRTALVAFADPRGTALDIAGKAPHGARLIELQITCPLRAYVELRLGATPITPADPGVDRRDRGRILHRALQTLWQQHWHDHQTLVSRDAALIGADIEAAVDAAIAERWPFDAGDLLDQRLRQRERERTIRVIQKSVEFERARAPFRVLECEQVHALQAGGLTLELRVDRVDVAVDGDAAGQLLIIDYKSGQKRPVDWFGERPDAAQLLTYLASWRQYSPQPVSGLANVHLTPRDVEVAAVIAHAGLLPRSKLVPDWERQLTRWGALVDAAAAQFAAGEARVDPKEDACERCHLELVCRRQQFLRPTATAENGDGGSEGA